MMRLHLGVIAHMHLGGMNELLKSWRADSCSVAYYEHSLSYAILAIAMITILVIYPSQKFLNQVPVHWHVLHSLVGVFHGCYKNGMEPCKHGLLSYCAT
jgi:hypothetical protein